MSQKTENPKPQETADLIHEVKTRIMGGGEVTFEEALQFIELENEKDLENLYAAAHALTFQFHGKKPSLCSLVNAKSYLCSEDCHFCSQSVHFDTKVDRYPLMANEDIMTIARRFETLGIQNFCIVTSGGALTDHEFGKVLQMIKQLKAETTLNIDASLGFLTPERTKLLKEAGLRRFNSNLQTSPEFYPEIVTTHSYETRMETLRLLLEGGLEICSGGILNLGESRRDRVQLAFELKPFKPHCLPINILNPRPGTPLENRSLADPREMVKTIAVFRFVHPWANIKLAGGRELNLGTEYQQLALRSGANGLIVGGYLTTKGNPLAADQALLQGAGYQWPESEALQETNLE